MRDGRPLFNLCSMDAAPPLMLNREPDCDKYWASYAAASASSSGVMGPGLVKRGVFVHLVNLERKSSQLMHLSLVG